MYCNTVITSDLLLLLLSLMLSVTTRLLGGVESVGSGLSAIGLWWLQSEREQQLRHRKLLVLN
jgi:hypothetical protein